MQIDSFIVELLHIDDISNNRLLDLDGDGTAKTYYLTSQEESRLLTNLTMIAKERYGKVGNTILRHSALGEEQRIGQAVKFLDWECADGTKDPKKLNKYIDSTYKDLKMKGNNPLFLGIGGLRWIVSNGKGESKEIVSPILIYPIRLIRSGSNTPVTIEFVSDDVFVNPCLTAKLESMWGKEVAKAFPHPNGPQADLSDPVNLTALGDGIAYFNAVKAYAEKNAAADVSGKTVFKLEEVVAISQYNHNELCSYYDIRKHRDLIDSNPMIDRIFNERAPAKQADITTLSAPVAMILPRDSAQENMIKRIVAGESMIIKGPPGTGKTQTIANVVAALLAADKKVLLASQKAAALTEVYGKLPTKLQKFVMLLDSETEEQAANLNPSTVLSELKGLLRERKAFDDNARVQERYEAARTELNKAIDFLARYVETTFTDNLVAGVSYFEALDRYCKNDLRTIKFTEALRALRLTREEYEETVEAVEKIGGYFDFLTGEGKHSIKLSPWYPLDGMDIKDTEGALDAYKQIAEDIQALLEETKDMIGSNDALDDVSLACFVAWVEYALSMAEMERIATSTKNTPSVFQDAQKFLQEYLNKKDSKNLKAFRIRYEGFDELESLTKKMNAVNLDPALTVEDWKLFYQYKDALTTLTSEKNVTTCISLVSQLTGQELRIQQLKTTFGEVFRTNLAESENEAILKAYEPLSKYVDTDATAPKALDFKGKNAVKVLMPLSYLNDVSFAELLKGVVAYNDLQAAEKERANIYASFSRMLGKEATTEEVLAFLIYMNYAQQSGKVNGYWKQFIEFADCVAECVEHAARTTGENYTLGALQEAYKAHLAYDKFRNQAQRFMELIQLENGQDEENIADRVAAVLAWSKFAQSCNLEQLQNLMEGAAERRSACKEAVALAKKIGQALKAFEETYFENLYSVKNVNVTFKELKFFLTQATDRNAVNAAVQFLARTQNEDNLLPLDTFFRGFENNPEWRQLASFEAYFEHAVFGLAIKAYSTLLGNARNGRGAMVDSALEKWWEKSTELDEAQVDRIENLCMRRLKPDDPDFAFLEAEKANAGSIRLMLKQHAVGLMKLKKCFLLSPYSVSVLFGGEEFFDFDVVIMDEASQLTPTGALPALLRSKQCVLVGDEYQMPPIKHFASTADRIITNDDGDEFAMEADLSILSFALKNEAFLSNQLTCHYRSETESLIAFSQKKYYQGMRTFPCATPKKDGVGIVDVYVPNGALVNGKNQAEAAAVIDCLQRHFDKYFDEETGVLSESVGVVAFGVEQQQAILSAIPDALKKKIKRAEESFPHPMKEKLIFFKTIEKVQGQEINHLILSMTYGRRENGAIYQHFGELNNGKLGQCIFNVAVTRAKRSITVIHSIKASDLDSERIQFIKEYLSMAENFSDEKRQFVSQEPGEGFLRSVGNFIASCGISEDRIVYNYGVTEDSVRIPIAILSEDKERALMGIWCEWMLAKKTEYLDYNARYFNTLRYRGWKLYRAFAHDWIDNTAAEQDRLRAFIMENLNR